MAAELVGISLTVTLVFFIISLAVVIFSADKFIDYSSVLAGRLGVSEFIIGLTLNSFWYFCSRNFCWCASLFKIKQKI